MVRRIRSWFDDKELILIFWRLAVIIGFAGWMVVGSVLGFMVHNIYARVERLESCSPESLENRISKLENTSMLRSEFFEAIKMRDDIRNNIISRVEKIDTDNKQEHACIRNTLDAMNTNITSQFIELHKYLRDNK